MIDELKNALVADGSDANRGVWQRWFSHYTPIVDFVHTLMYVDAEATAGRTGQAGWAMCRQWAHWLWSGDLPRLLAALH